MIKQRAITVLNDWKLCDELLFNNGVDSDKIFIHLIRPKLILSDDLYKNHVLELINRFKNNECLSLATKSEVLAFMGYVNETVSLPGNEFVIAMRDLFNEIVSDSEMKEDILKELHAGVGSFDEPKSKTVLDILRKKLSNKNRIV